MNEHAQTNHSPNTSHGLDEKVSKPLRQYLRRLEAALSDAPDSARAEIIADVRAHVEDASDAGEPVENVLRKLGDVNATASQYRNELGLSAERTNVSARAGLVLHGAAIIIGVLTGCLVGFLTLFEIGASGLGESDGEAATIAWTYGLGIALLTFVPALLAVLPLVLPAMLRGPVALANAVIVSALCVVDFPQIGMFYVPLAVLMWMAVFVPSLASRGLDVSRAMLWRALGCALLVLPAVLLVAGIVSGAILVEPLSVVVMAALIGLSIGFLLGSRVAFFLVAIVGAAGMVLGMLFPGMLTIAFWWSGGVYLAVGLGAIATLRPKPDTRTESGTGTATS